MASVTMQSRQDVSSPQVETQLRLVEPARRRGSAVQGRALETLGHAIEYLIDSQLWRGRDWDPKDDQQAIQILMRLSREVFAECPEVISMGRRFRAWVAEHVTGDAKVRAIR